jgi:hypothetical protein
LVVMRILRLTCARLDQLDPARGGSNLLTPGLQLL